jgi:hypothetical protein
MAWNIDKEKACVGVAGGKRRLNFLLGNHSVVWITYTTRRVLGDSGLQGERESSMRRDRGVVVVLLLMLEL